MLIAFDQAAAEAAGLTVEHDGAKVRFTFADGSGPAECFIDTAGNLDVIPERCIEHRKLARALGPA